MGNIKEIGLLKALDTGPVICAEGYLFEMERRGYLKANLFVPEVVLDNPQVVEQLHRDFVHSGSDVVLAFTYYVDREKLKAIDINGLLRDGYTPEDACQRLSDLGADVVGLNCYRGPGTIEN
jgi:methionine synthase I (cobalamin-dependent)